MNLSPITFCGGKKKLGRGGGSGKENSEAKAKAKQTREEDEVRMNERRCCKTKTLIPFSQLKQCLTPKKKTNYESDGPDPSHCISPMNSLAHPPSFFVTSD